MCDPITLGGLALSAAGTGINAKINNDAVSEQNAQNRRTLEIEKQARREEQARQQAFEAASAEEVKRALEIVDPEKAAETVEEIAADPDNSFAEVAENYNTTTLPGEVANADVEGSLGRIVSDAVAQTRKKVGGIAALSKLGTLQSATQDGLGRLSSNVQTIGSNRRGSLNASRLETSIPSAFVTPSSSIVGDLLSIGGSAIAGARGKSIGKKGGKKPLPSLGDLFGI